METLHTCDLYDLIKNKQYQTINHKFRNGLVIDSFNCQVSIPEEAVKYSDWELLTLWKSWWNIPSSCHRLQPALVLASQQNKIDFLEWFYKYCVISNREAIISIIFSKHNRIFDFWFSRFNILPESIIHTENIYLIDWMDLPYPTEDILSRAGSPYLNKMKTKIKITDKILNNVIKDPIKIAWWWDNRELCGFNQYLKFTDDTLKYLATHYVDEIVDINMEYYLIKIEEIEYILKHGGYDLVKRLLHTVPGIISVKYIDNYYLLKHLWDHSPSKVDWTTRSQLIDQTNNASVLSFFYDIKTNLAFEYTEYALDRLPDKDIMDWWIERRKEIPLKFTVFNEYLAQYIKIEPFVENIKGICTICFDYEDMVKLSCGHCYHFDCFVKSKSPRCSYCKKLIKLKN